MMKDLSYRDLMLLRKYNSIKIEEINKEIYDKVCIVSSKHNNCLSGNYHSAYQVKSELIEKVQLDAVLQSFSSIRIFFKKLLSK